MPPHPNQTILDLPSSDERATEDAFLCFFLAGLFGGTAGLAAAGGIFAGAFCIALAKFLHREYQYFARKGYYGCERRREEAHRRFEAGIASLSQHPESWQSRYNQIFADYIAELRQIDRDFEQQTGRSPYEVSRESERRKDGGRGWSPWASPKAVQRRKRRRARRLALWREWAQKCSEAVRLGKTPLPSPAEGRVGGGAPIRRLCERSSSPPPTPEALLAQYDKAKGRGPVEEKIRLGSMMLDIEAAVDSSLVRDPSGEIVGRNAGIRGWIAERCPQLLSHYASLMGYRRLADEFRKVHGLRDPHPATRFLEPEFPAECFAPALREPMRSRYVAARRLLASPSAKTAKGFAEALARERLPGRERPGATRRTG